MAYLLENQAVAHSNNILETLQTWSEEEPDVHLISNQGAVLQTHRVYLRLYSSLLNSVLRDISSDTIPSIIIPASTESLVNLIRILSTGVTISEQKEDLLDVVNTAELLGIFLKGVQVGTKDTPDQHVSISTDIDHEGGKKEKENETKKREKGTKKKEKVTDKNEKEAKKKNANENPLVEVKKESEEVDSETSLHVKEAIGPQTQNIDQGMSVKEELLSYSDSSFSLSSYLDSTNLDNGQAVVPENKLYANTSGKFFCKDCEKSFAKTENLKRHLLIHSNEKPYPCDDCEFKSNRKDKLDQHKNNKHSSIEHEACSECGKNFADKNKLKRHLVIHTDEKPFSCDECESEFRRKDKLNDHKKAKHSERVQKKDHKCQVCKKAYGTNWYLNNHMEKVHSSEQT